MMMTKLTIYFDDNLCTYSCTILSFDFVLSTCFVSLPIEFECNLNHALLEDKIVHRGIPKGLPGTCPPLKVVPGKSDPYHVAATRYEIASRLYSPMVSAIL